MDDEIRQEMTERSLCEPCRIKWEEHQDGKILATMHCIDCEENLCESCTGHHLRQKMLKNHVIVAIEEFQKKGETEEAISTTIQTTDILLTSSKATREESPDDRNFQTEPTDNRDDKTMILTNQTTEILPKSSKATQDESPVDRKFQAEPTENKDEKSMISSDQTIDILPESSKPTKEESPDDTDDINIQAEPTEKRDGKTMLSTNQTMDVFPVQSVESQEVIKDRQEYTKKNEVMKTVISTANRG